MNLLTAEQIAAITCPSEVVEVEVFGAFKVRGLTAKETEDLDERKDAATRILLFGIVGEDGNRLFSDSQIAVVENLPQSVAKPLQQAILRLSGQKVKGFDPKASAEKK